MMFQRSHSEPGCPQPGAEGHSAPAFEVAAKIRDLRSLRAEDSPALNKTAICAFQAAKFEAISLRGKRRERRPVRINCPTLPSASVHPEHAGPSGNSGT